LSVATVSAPLLNNSWAMPALVQLTVEALGLPDAPPPLLALSARRKPTGQHHGNRGY